MHLFKNIAQVQSMTSQWRVEPVPGSSGTYHAVAWLRPWPQFEELTISLRLVASIPKIG